MPEPTPTPDPAPDLAPDLTPDTPAVGTLNISGLIRGHILYERLTFLRILGTAYLICVIAGGLGLIFNWANPADIAFGALFVTASAAIVCFAQASNWAYEMERDTRRRK